MKIRTASLAAAAALLAMTPAAFAADMPAPPPPVEAVVPPEVTTFDWTGFYVGAFGGYGFGEFDDNFFEATDAEGAFAGGTVGYNMQFGTWLIGLEADGAWSGIDNEDENVDYDASLEWFGTVRGRLGFTFDRFLVYGTGGAAFGEVEYDAVDASGSDTQLGWTAGAGVEAAVTQNISLKAEYLYIDLGETEIDDAVDVDFQAHTIKGGINYRF